MKISILEKDRAPSGVRFHEGLMLRSFSMRLVVGEVSLDVGLLMHETKGDLDVEGRSHLFGQLPDQIDMLASVRIEYPVLLGRTAHTVAEPDRAEKDPARVSPDEPKEVRSRSRFGILTQDTERAGLDQRIQREAGA